MEYEGRSSNYCRRMVAATVDHRGNGREAWVQWLGAQTAQRLPSRSTLLQALQIVPLQTCRKCKLCRSWHCGNSVVQENLYWVSVSVRNPHNSSRADRSRAFSQTLLQGVFPPHYPSRDLYAGSCPHISILILILLQHLLSPLLLKSPLSDLRSARVLFLLPSNSPPRSRRRRKSSSHCSSNSLYSLA